MSHLSLSPCTGSRLQLTSSSRHWCLHIEQLQPVLYPPTSTYLWQSTSPQEVWDLRASNASWCHHSEAQNHSPECFHSPFLAGRMNFPPPSGMLNPCQFSSDIWKLISSVITWLHLKKKTSLSFLNFALFPLTSYCPDRICSEQCLDICITSTSCVWRGRTGGVTLVPWPGWEWGLGGWVLQRPAGKSCVSKPHSPDFKRHASNWR